jgi:hypothetical protein
MERLFTTVRARARASVAIIATTLLVLSFALVALLLSSRPQANAGASVPGCSNGAAVPSSIVGAHFSVSSSTVTYFFDSIGNQSPNSSTGVPGLIAYCVKANTAGGVTVTSVVHGNGGALWQHHGGANGDNEFSFSRNTGPNTILLDGTTNIEIGTGTWTGVPPSIQNILLHIADPAECKKLYGGNPPTCFVLPSNGSTPTPTPTSTPGPTATPTPTSTPGPTPTPGGPTPTPTPKPRPTPLPTPIGTPPPGK